MTATVPSSTYDSASSEPVSWAWRSGSCSVLGHRFELYVEADDGFRDAMEPIIRPFRGPDPGPTETVHRYEVRHGSAYERLPYTLDFDTARVSSGRHAGDLCASLSWHINQGVIQAASRRHVLLHAAAATFSGMTVVLPAEQESGKTTTVAGLLRAGFDYVTDEAVAIDPQTTWITPFPKTLSLEQSSWSMFPEGRPPGPELQTRQWQVPAEKFGARVHQKPVPPPRLIIFPRYTPGATTTVQRVSPGEAVRELVHCCFGFPDASARNLRVLGRVATGTTSARLVIGSLDSAVDAIKALLSEQLVEGA